MLAYNVYKHWSLSYIFSGAEDNGQQGQVSTALPDEGSPLLHPHCPSEPIVKAARLEKEMGAHTAAPSNSWPRSTVLHQDNEVLIHWLEGQWWREIAGTAVNHRQLCAHLAQPQLVRPAHVAQDVEVTILHDCEDTCTVMILLQSSGAKERCSSQPWIPTFPLEQLIKLKTHHVWAGHAGGSL